jgi:hypoxanthine-guanine phosphoribosyltransferase
MVEIKEQYKQTYEKTLADDIKEQFKEEDIKNILLALIKGTFVFLA